MNAMEHPRFSTWIMAAGAAALFTAGALTMYWFGNRPGPAAPSAPQTAAPASPPAAPPAAGIVLIPMSAELIRRAGIEVQPVGEGQGGGGLRLPGTVQPDAYRKVEVRPLAGGRVTRMPVELGQHVSRGLTVAEIYSPDFAAAQTLYLSALAMAHADDARLERTERLAGIGAASQQELEQVRAEHTAHHTEVGQAVARLRVLGIDPTRMSGTDADHLVSATLRVTAPQDGVVVERPANVGATVESSTVLLVTAALSPVWVVADLYERDFRAVRVGSLAVVTTDAYPGVEIRGRVTYIAPQVRPETRTAEVRIDVPNSDARLRFGMLAMVSISDPAPAGVFVPKSALQTIGSRTFVYVAAAGAPSGFVAREVTVAEGSGDAVVVTAGLITGERVVTKGSFSVRAEAERLGIQPPASSPSTPSPIATGERAPGAVAVTVSEKGFEPSTITLRAGVPARLVFTRTSEATCAKEVVFPAYQIRKALPLNQAVTIELTPRKDAAPAFVCGMGMLSGKLIVQ